MVERYWRQSPLAHLNLAARAARAARADNVAADAGVVLIERPFRACVNLRGETEAPFLGAIEQAFGFVLPLNAPETAREGDLEALWLGPNEWLIVGPDQDGAGGEHLAVQFRRALQGQHAAVTDVTESYTVIGVEGARAREVLQKGTGLDLHPRSFRPGHVAQTLLARADVIIHRIGPRAYDLYVRRSFAEYLWRWLEDAGLEYGAAVGAADGGRRDHIRR